MPKIRTRKTTTTTTRKTQQAQKETTTNKRRNKEERRTLTNKINDRRKGKERAQLRQELSCGVLHQGMRKKKRRKLIQ